MLAKYKSFTDQQRWIEYGRLKAAWVEQNGYSSEAKYDAFITRITRELGI